ncbi:MAG: hypothetical protein IPN38_09430 [Flavobacteriales bacterium]|nr:hypothetical protein [Flavobacteriales bacterium]
MDHEPQISTAPGRSLCINCLNAPDCIQRIAARGHVQYCDLHAVADGPRTLMNGASGNGQQHAFVPLAGLCNNCDHVHTCVLRKPGQVVLHCQHHD